MELVNSFNVRKNKSLRLLKWPKNGLILHFNFTFGKGTNKKNSYLGNVQSKKYSVDSDGILRITVISNESFRLGFKGKVAAN